MAEAERAAGKGGAEKRLTELRVTAHLMSLDTGLFCIVQSPSPAASDGLPGLRITLPPGSPPVADAVTIRGFRDDGWLSGQGDAVLVRVAGGPANVLVTVYQAAGAAAESAPSVQVMKLLDTPGGTAAPRATAPAAQRAPQPAGTRAPAAPEVMDVLAHVSGAGDVGARLGEWLGERGGKRWIEGFAVAPTQFVSAADLEYQAVLGRGWMSPWVEGGQFCGSRGMALPLLGLRVRLRGDAAERFECWYSASFVDGTEVGPVAGGEPCEAESLAAVEAIRIGIRPRGSAQAPAPAAASPAVARVKPGRKRRS
jgi:hypothetical protein